MTIRRILVPTDFGPAAAAALSYARDLARVTGASVYLLHVVDDIAARFIDFPYTQLGDVQVSMEQAARGQLDDLAATLNAETFDVHNAILRSTAAAHTIVGYAADEHIDLIVMGTHGRAPVTRVFLGSVADRVVRTATCPVLTVREHATPTAQRAANEQAAHPMAV